MYLSSLSLFESVPPSGSIGTSESSNAKLLLLAIVLEFEGGLGMRPKVSHL